ncbi:MAG: N-6 DNA methylase [Cyanobacteriota bacterium]|nr:N-6 DNA methylase [Cyanobacteriota bacterium]
MNTLPLEKDTVYLINRSLENLGWRFEGKDKNVFQEQPRTEAERRLLEHKRPDYVLYSKDHEPLIVIEAKKKGERIDSALEQGIFYAKRLKAPLVFATDGVFCKSFHTQANRTPMLNGEELDEFIREAMAMKFLGEWNVNTVSQKVQYDRQELIKIFDTANNMLRSEGLRAGEERFGEFANILFLKLISESEQNKFDQGIQTKFDFSTCSWDIIKKQSSSSRVEYINNMVYKKLNDLYNTEIFTSLKIRDNDVLKEIMGLLDPLVLTDIDSDVKGDAFEYFLKASTATKNDLGEYFTPRHIVKTMVRLVNPQIGEKVYDPFCGTGGFLIESFRHIYNNMPRNKETEKMLRENTIFGNEITSTARITKMNMILAGDGHSGIHMQDSLANPIEGKYDVVLANMPYSQKTKHGSLYDLPSTNGDSICVQHCMKAISSASENGRMAIVVPEGFLFRKELAKTREYLLENSELQSIISLPQGVFLPYTGVKTNIIFATKINQKISKSQKKKNYWYFDVKSDGYSLDNHRRKLDTPSDLQKYEEFRKFDEEQKDEMLKIGFDVIPFEKVVKNDFNLVGSRYKSLQNYNSKNKIVKLNTICEVIAGQSPDSKNYNESQNGIPFYQGNKDFGDIYIKKPTKWTTEITKSAQESDVLISVRAPVGEVNLCNNNICIGRGLMALRCNAKIMPKYLLYVLMYNKEKWTPVSTGSTFKSVTKKDVENFEIPLPPLEVQNKIVEELDSYQQIIDGAKRIVNNYKPNFVVNESWKCYKLNQICDVRDGTHDSPQYITKGFPLIMSKNLTSGYIDFDNVNYISEKDFNAINKRSKVDFGDILMPMIGTIGYPVIVNTEKPFAIKNVALIKFNNDKVLNKYVQLCLSSYHFKNYVDYNKRGNTQKFIALGDIRNYEIPLPNIKEQKEIVAKIEAERALIEPNKQIIEVFTKKIQDRINEIFN